MYFFTQKYLPAAQKAEILNEKMTKKVPKRPPSPAKADVLHEKKCRFLLKMSIQPLKNGSFAWKKCIFLLKNTSQSLKKLKFWMKKWQQKEKKRYPNEHPAPQKPEVLHEKLKTVLR